MPHLRVKADHREYRLEYVWHGPLPPEAPSLVFLHEGLGSVSRWRDFPERVVEATGYGAVVYSRAGYGNSDAIDLPRPVSFMHNEALITLPQVLDALEVRKAILVGHSDGGSIALIYAGGSRDARVRGLILEAPHVFAEELGINSIRAITEEYRSGDLKSRLERHHGGNVACAFEGWSQVWLAPEFRSWNIEEYLPQIRVPVLLIQGESDQYGTVLQIEAIEKGCRGAVNTVVLSDCGHNPHLDQPQQTLEAIKKFLRQKILERADVSALC